MHDFYPREITGDASDASPLSPVDSGLGSSSSQDNNASRMPNPAPPKIPQQSRESLFSYHTANDTPPTSQSTDGSYHPFAQNLPFQPKTQSSCTLAATAVTSAHTSEKWKSTPSITFDLSGQPPLCVVSDVTSPHAEQSITNPVINTDNSSMASMLATLDVFNSPPQDLSFLVTRSLEATQSNGQSDSFCEDMVPKTPDPVAGNPIYKSFLSRPRTPKSTAVVVGPEGQPRTSTRSNSPHRDQEDDVRDLGCWGRFLLVFGVKSRGWDHASHAHL